MRQFIVESLELRAASVTSVTLDPIGGTAREDSRPTKGGLGKGDLHLSVPLRLCGQPPFFLNTKITKRTQFNQICIVKVWSAATCRRFLPTRHIASVQSAVVPAHSKILAPAFWQHLRWIYNDLKQFKPFKTPYFLSHGGVHSHAGHDIQNDATPLGLGKNWERLPRVAHGAQPWAEGRNPVGIVRSQRHGR